MTRRNSAVAAALVFSLTACDQQELALAPQLAASAVVVKATEEIVDAQMPGIAPWGLGVSLRILTPPVGSQESGATAVNDAGFVVGWSRDVRNGCSHILIWDPTGAVTDLGRCGIPERINNSNQVVGYLDLTNTGPSHAFLWSASTDFVDLGTLGGTSSVAYGISETGAIVGWAQGPTGAPDGFLYSSQAGMQSLTSLVGLAVGHAKVVNTRGEVLGNLYSGPAFVWNPQSGIKYVPSLVPGSSTSPTAWSMNDRGWVTGEDYSSNGSVHAYRWIPGSAPVDLGALSQATEYSTGYDISEDGAVVGWSHIPITPIVGARAFGWTPRLGIRPLPKLDGPVCKTYDVNRKGTIAAGYCFSNGESQAVIWSR